MGLLDNNKIFATTTPFTGLENSEFIPVFSNEAVDVWMFDRKTSTDKVLDLTYRDIYGWHDSGNVYIAQGKITDTPKTIAINDTNFPGLRKSAGAYPEVSHIIAVPFTYTQGVAKHYYEVVALDPIMCRICVIFKNGQIFHNYPSCFDDYDFERIPFAKGTIKVTDLFDKFAESVVWDLPGRKAPVKTETGDDAALIATGAYYYNPALPDNCYEFHPAINQPNGYGNSGFGATTNKNPISIGTDVGVRARFWRVNMDNENCNSFTYMGGLVVDDLFTMLGTYRTNTGPTPCRMCVFGTQDGGRNWFNMYEFAGSDRNVQDGVNYGPSAQEGIMLAQEGSVGTGVYQVKRRSIIVPTATIKEPESIFEYTSPVAVTSISGTSSGITFTTAAAHGLTKYDTVVVEFQSGVSANNRPFDWMVNPNTTPNSGGNGILLKVQSVTPNTFTVSMYVHNPNSGLPIRHIHAMNRCADGVTVNCGEAYPNGWVLFNPIRALDFFDGYNVADVSQNPFTRVTSTRDSVQRTLGSVIQVEKDGTYLYCGIDHAYIPMNELELPEGRTIGIEHSSCGVWKIPLAGVDSFKDNAKLLLPTVEPAFGFQQILGALVFVGQSGEVAISYDNGESWHRFKVLPYTNQIYLRNWSQYGCHFSGPTYDRKFSLNNILIQLKK